MRALEFFDTWILRKCTKISHRLQELTGLTNYFFVIIGLFISSIPFVIQIVNYWWPILEEKSDIWSLILGFMWLASITRDVHQCNRNEERLYNNQTLYSVYNSNFKTRLIYFGVAILGTIYCFLKFGNLFRIISVSSYVWGIVIAYYFAAVTPLPPGRSKVAKLVESISAGFRKMTPVSTRG